MTSDDAKGGQGTCGEPGDRPVKAILCQPRQRPGETKEEAARRLARELFGKVKPTELTPERPPTTSPE
jgi:hypothetical protein